MYKFLHPDAEVIATDISQYAVESAIKWERIYGVKLHDYYSCKSYRTDESDGSIDHVFTFASAHHFVRHRKTLIEISRILKSGGCAIYFYEPTTPSMFYKFAYWRVNRKRPHVPEDVIVIKTLAKIANECGLTLEVDYYPSLKKRGALEFVYYFILSKVPILQKVLPCTSNLVFTKK